MAEDIVKQGLKYLVFCVGKYCCQLECKARAQRKRGLMSNNVSPKMTRRARKCCKCQQKSSATSNTLQREANIAAHCGGHSIRENHVL